MLAEGVKLEQTFRGISNNHPDAKLNHVVHVRPKAINATDKVKLPDG